MGVPINDGNDVRSPRYLDLRQGKIVGGKSVPYANPSEALAEIPLSRRAEGLTVFIKNGAEIEEWQFSNGVADVNLVKKESGGSGLPLGGLTGQVLAKMSDDDGDAGWEDVEGGNYIEVTKTEADTLIANGKLNPGVLYQISGVHKLLYNDGTDSGTSVFLRAITNNQFAPEGVGEFYTPDYATYPIWHTRSTFATVTAVVGTFNRDEMITANNGAKAKLYTFLSAKMFINPTGDWAAATSITGDVTGATANITGALVKAFAVGDRVAYGGYIWENLNGNAGSVPATMIALDATEWQKLPFTDAGYKKSFDQIGIDFENDRIIERRDKVGNIVKEEVAVNATPAIARMKWGDHTKTYQNRISESYFDCVNSEGRQYNNLLSGRAVMINNVNINGGIFSNVLGVAAEVSNNTLINSQVQHNQLIGLLGYVNSNNASKINSNTVASGAIVGNELSGGQIVSNVIDAGFIVQNTLGDTYSGTTSQINSNNLISNTSMIIGNHLVGGSSVNLNKVIGGLIRGNNLAKRGSINSNTCNSFGYITENYVFGFAQINGNTITGTSSSNPSSISNNSNKVGQISNNTLNGARCDITSCDIGQTLSYADLGGQGKINNANLTSGGTIEDCTIYTGGELNGITATNAQKVTKLLVDSYKLNFGGTALIAPIAYSKFERHSIEHRIQVTFTGAAGKGAIGAVDIQPIQILAGYFIEEVRADVGAGLTGAGAILNFGIATDAPDSGLNDVTGGVTALNAAGITKIALGSFARATATRALTLAVKDAAVTAGALNIIVKLSKLN